MRLLIILLSFTLIVSTGCNNSSENEDKSAETSVEPKSYEDKLSYSLGIVAASSVVGKLEQNKLTHLIVPEKMAKGINDFIAGKEIEIEPKQAKENLNRFFRKLQEEGSIGEMQQKDMEVLSYSIGVDAIREIFGQITESKIDTIIDVKMVVTAMNDFILNRKVHINANDAQMMIEDFFEKTNKMKNEKMLTQYEGNRTAGIEFLENNKKRPGVKVTQSGLQIETIREGKGKQPKLGDMVEVHYTGTFIDGKKFDSSLDRKEPFSFGIDYNYPVIQGWIDGAKLMKQGGKYKLYLPYELAYKESLNSPIPPYSALVFEIEVLSVKEGEAMPMYEGNEDKYSDSKSGQENQATIEKWKNKSLKNGSTPYSSCFGSNNSCNGENCSEILIKTGSLDVIVTIKNNDGKVVRHAYIDSRNSYSFNLPNGNYQVFFYSGTGWNPEQEMNSSTCATLKGGFVLNENVSKDTRIDLNNQIMNYELFDQIDGNFKQKPSNKKEAF